ncbi:DUF924 domain-containing protein [Enterobacteriaceae bacterium 4M9]|nr:DUF924 domain-containing protein [Enterobacteriaceae bacterium 4M9]
MKHEVVIRFWFDELKPAQWFVADSRVDAQIRWYFLDVWEAACQDKLAHWRTGALAHWRATQDGRLAEILVLDQFSRNLWRNNARAWAQDDKALALAQEAIKQPEFPPQDANWRNFILMPLMHAESAAVHQQAIQLFDFAGNGQTLRAERQHKAIIDRFGRFPHRNALLGRTSTPEERAFLASSTLAFMK